VPTNVTAASGPAVSIGEAAREANCRPSTLRYYESVGVLPAIPRDHGQRRYSPEHIDRIQLIRRARALGFSMRDLARLIDGFAPGTPASARWEDLASAKIAEIDDLLADLQHRRKLLQHLAKCACRDLADCARQISA
jgi:MerR family copper efflux transcriptional regulator